MYVCVCVCSVELKSKTIAGKMLEGIVRVCDQELQDKAGQPQVHVHVYTVCFYKITKLPTILFVFYPHNVSTYCSQEGL